MRLFLIVMGIIGFAYFGDQFYNLSQQLTPEQRKIFAMLADLYLAYFSMRLFFAGLGGS